MFDPIVIPTFRTVYYSQFFSFYFSLVNNTTNFQKKNCMKKKANFQRSFVFYFLFFICWLFFLLVLLFVYFYAQKLCLLLQWVCVHR